MPGKMSPNLADAYGKAKEIQRMERGNPRLSNMSRKEQVKTLLRKKGETGSPDIVDAATKKKNDDAVKDLLESKGFPNLPRMSASNKPVNVPKSPKVKPKSRPIGPEGGNPKEDLQEVSAQLGKASQLHGDQSKRVAGIAEGMKGEVGNPYMKRGKSKYGM
jgi:hypothetical protein